MVFITRELGEVVRTVIAEGTADNSFTCPDPHATAFWWSALWRFLATLTSSTPPPTVAKL